MMRELDTVSPVVWPSWCYSGEGQNDSETSGTGSEPGKDLAGPVGRPPGRESSPKSRGKRRRNSLMSLRYQRTNEDSNGDGKNPENKIENCKDIEIKKENVKTERLSPIASGNSNPNADNNSSSSRSGTPSSSYPGTPPGNLPDSRDRGSSPNPGSGSHIKQMEQMMMSRNYSDFMRSLAAKYNNANPNDYFGTSRNGFSQSLDQRFGGFKSGTATPFVGLMAPLNAAAVSPSSQQTSVPSSSSCSGDQQKSCGKSQNENLGPGFGMSGLNGLNPFAGSGALFPPVIDMSSTQALLNMVRTASAQNQAQLESYLKGVQVHPGKRAGESSPLDLSSASPLPKKIKKENSKDNFYDNILNLPLLDAFRTKELGGKISTKSRSISPNSMHKKNLQNSLNNLQNTIAGLSSRDSPNRTCSSLCGTDGRSCSDLEGRRSISHWTVDDVCSFVAGIDVCAEYEKNFREERIDGASLPLLTEEHLTNSLSMKLGPALKLRALVARRLGHCTVCQHCVHCHGASSSNVPSSAVTGNLPVLPNPGNRPNSAGN